MVRKQLEVLSALSIFGVLFSPMTHNPRLATAFVAEPQIKVSARVDKTKISAGERLRFDLNITGRFKHSPKIHIETLEGFRVISSGQSQEMTLGLDGIQQSLTFAYTLAPTGAGKHTLGPVQVEYEGETYETQPIEIEVTEGDGGARSPRPGSEPELKGEYVL